MAENSSGGGGPADSRPGARLKEAAAEWAGCCQGHGGRGAGVRAAAAWAVAACVLRLLRPNPVCRSPRGAPHHVPRLSSLPACSRLNQHGPERGGAKPPPRSSWRSPRPSMLIKQSRKWWPQQRSSRRSLQPAAAGVAGSSSSRRRERHLPRSRLHLSPQVRQPPWLLEPAPRHSWMLLLRSLDLLYFNRGTAPVCRCRAGACGGEAARKAGAPGWQAGQEAAAAGSVSRGAAC